MPQFVALCLLFSKFRLVRCGELHCAELSQLAWSGCILHAIARIAFVDDPDARKLFLTVGVTGFPQRA
jgi:hypothetical protein